MSTSELWDQKSTLMTRLSYAQQNFNPQIAQQIQRGIAHLDQLLVARSKATDHDLI